MAEDMITRAAKALYDCESVRAGHSAKVIAGIARGPRDVGIEPFEECAETTWLPDARHVLLAALDPEDESLVSAIAQRLADDATVARNELRLIRQGIDLSSAEPVSPSIFKKDARVMIATLKAMAQGVGASAATVRRCLSRTWPKKEWKRMTLNISSLVERLEDERDELKDRSRIAGEFSALDPMTAQRIANTMFEAGETISALTKQLEERDRVATEAVEFIGVMRDEMVIAGWPSGDRTVLLANVRALLSRAPAEQVQGQGEK